MHDRPSLLSRIKNQEPQDQPQDLTLLSRLSQNHPAPSLLSRMNSQVHLQELPLHQNLKSIKTYSSSATPSSKDIERGRSRKRLRTLRSSRSSHTPSEIIETERMQHSVHSLQPSRVTTSKLERQQKGEGRSTRNSAPPALLYRIQMNTSRMRSQSPSESRLMNQHMHGSRAEETNAPFCETPSLKLSNSSKHTPLIPKQPNVHSSTSQIVLSSQIPSGNTSLLEEPSTSMQYSADNSQPLTTIRKSRNSGILRSPSERSSPQSWLRTEEIGLLPGTEQSGLPSSPFPIVCKSSRVTENTLSTCSPSLTPASTIVSSPLIRQSGKELEELGTLSSPISRNSPISKSLTWTRSGYQSSRDLRKRMEHERVSEIKTGRETNLATSGMTANATKRKRIAVDCTSATSAGKQVIEERSVDLGSSDFVPQRPRYMQRFVWTDVNDTQCLSPTASCTLSDSPLPRPPPEEFMNVDAITTIRNNPHLFEIVTPIHVTRFEELLESHPNRPFVLSVCTSLREGFWPWANTQKEEYPATWDFSDRPPKTEREAAFLRDQRDIEINAGRYSNSFGTDLLPGMYSTPIHAVPKPRSEKMRLVNDHSAGSFSLNSMIAREDVAGAKMDTISDLIGALLRYRKDHPDNTVILFKSDVSAAYRRLPLHPLWQVKQIVTIDENRHVDRCTSFGGRGSCRDYTAFMGLVIWIAIFIKFITDLFGYIDDNFSFDEEGNVLWYEPYKCYYPAKQTRLLELWDEIDLPHEKSKQEYGPILRIIGFMVDPNLMRVSMDEDDRTRLIQHVSDFVATAPGGTRRSLREFQQLAGWINWSFNVFPLLKPALSNVYKKIGGKTQTHAKIFVSKAVVRDLTWFESHVRQSNGVYLFEDVDWNAQQADIIAYSDACMSSLGFFLKRSKEGFQCLTPQKPPKDSIFFFEALAVVSVVEMVTHLPSVPARLLVFSDNTNTVDIFNSLRSLPPYNELLKFTVSLLITYNISLRVVYIPGVDNIIADSLSRFENTKAKAACPGLSISSFQPPRLAMGQDF
jgi:hypothetical protein